MTMEQFALEKEDDAASSERRDRLASELADAQERLRGLETLWESEKSSLNRVGDLEGCKRHDDGSVTTPKGFKEAYEAYAAGGWMGLFRFARLPHDIQLA